jgi:prefoldin subunit 5
MNDDFKEELKDCYAEITRLRAEVEQLTTQWAKDNWLLAEIERLNAEVERVKTECDEIMALNEGQRPEELSGYARGAYFVAKTIRAALTSQEPKDDQ